MALSLKDPSVKKTIIRNQLFLSATLIFFMAMFLWSRQTGIQDPDETTGQTHYLALVHQYVTGHQIAGFWLGAGLAVIAIVNNLAYIFRVRRGQIS